MSLVSRISVAAALLVSAAASAQLTEDGQQFWRADSPGLTTGVEDDAWFGHALAVGDFDGNGFDDLAIGVPRRTVSTNSTAGEVLVLYGTEGGLGVGGHQVWNQDSPGVGDAAEVDDFFGWSLAAGDFDGDGYDELAVGVVSEAISGIDGAGMVQVFPGGPGGLSSDEVIWHQNTIGIEDTVEPDDIFGAALATGDFDEDGFQDLAIGAPFEDQEGVPTYTDIGAVHLLFGGAGGLSVAGARYYRPGDGVVGQPLPASFLNFGAALAAGPLLLNGQDQIAIGVPGLTVGGESLAGGVAVLNNPGGGGTIIAFFTQDSPVIPGVAEAGDGFGTALAIGRFDGHASASLAVGSPWESWEPTSADEAGAIHLVRRIATGQTSASLWLQDDVPPAESESFDHFGLAFAIGDFDADGLDDLVAGSPGEALAEDADDFGMAVLLRGDAENGLTVAGAQLLPLGVFVAEPDHRFGAALAAGRFSAIAGSELALAAPQMDLSLELAPLVPAGYPFADAGAVAVYSSIVLFRDGFESGDTSAWSSNVP